MPPSDLHNRLRRLRRRAVLATLLGEGSRHLAAALLVAGSLALLGRLLLDLTPARAALVLALAILVPFTVWMRARHRLLSATGAATWMDVRAGGTGALLTELEVPDERWSARTSALLARAPDEPRLTLAPAAARAAFALAFALFALWVPVPKATAGPTPAIFDAVLEDLREKLAALQEEITLDEETAEELEERLERLEAEARDAVNPEATFEAVDEMTARLEEEALEAREAMESANESLTEAGAFAEEDPERAQERLSEALKDLKDKGIGLPLPRDLADELGLDLDATELPPGVQLDPEKLAQLSKEMQELLREKLAELAAAGLLDFDLKLAELGELGELGELSDLAALEFELCEDCKNGEP